MMLLCYYLPALRQTLRTARTRRYAALKNALRSARPRPYRYTARHRP
jgi:hypothetical protein